MNKRIEMFLRSTSIDQKIFKYDSEKDDYFFITGSNLYGKYMSQLVKTHKSELKELLKELYESSESNWNTKNIITEIIYKYYKKNVKKIFEI